MSEIKLIVGLGNPGAEYAATRHNAGFWLADAWARQLGAHFAAEKKFFGETARAGSVRLLKPQTFMNRSGQAVQALADFYRIAPAEILVVHDELDLPCGSVKLKKGGGNGGHNGLKDIQARLGSADFWRLRIGIGHPGDKNQVVGYVLKKPPAGEQVLIDETLARCLKEGDTVLRGDFEAAMRVLHSGNG